MATHSQHKLLNGILIPEFLAYFRIEATKDNVSATKEIFKRYLKVAHTSMLSDRSMQRFVEAFKMLAAREFGVEIPIRDAEKTMTELLNQTNEDYDL
jgi:hypothetical protein